MAVHHWNIQSRRDPSLWYTPRLRFLDKMTDLWKYRDIDQTLASNASQRGFKSIFSPLKLGTHRSSSASCAWIQSQANSSQTSKPMKRIKWWNSSISFKLVIQNVFISRTRDQTWLIWLVERRFGDSIAYSRNFFIYGSKRGVDLIPDADVTVAHCLHSTSGLLELHTSCRIQKWINEYN